jgi:hypothetical protein
MSSEDLLIKQAGSCDCLMDMCDECGDPALKAIRDASGNLHYFCLAHWGEHLAFTGNNGRPYGL